MDMLAAMGTFARVVEAQSLSGAARGLGLSLPAVSRQIRALEEELGATLLLRTTRRMALTDRGQLVYESALRITRELDDTRARVRPSKDVRGSVVVSAPVSIALSLVVPRLPALAARHRHLRVDLRLEDRLVDFVGEGVDLAIRGGVAPPDSTAYVAHPLHRFRRVAVAAPAYLRKHKRPRKPADLARHTCLLQLGASGPSSRWRLVRGDEACDVGVDGPLRSTAPVVLRDLARAGSGVALVADWLVHDDLEEGRLERVLPGWESPEVTTWAVHRVELRGAPAIAAILEVLRA